MDRALNVKHGVVQDLTHDTERVIAANNARSQSSGLSASELEVLLFVIETSLKLQTRAQFFGWSQGMLQGLLPHELLVCALKDAHAPNYTMDRFHSRPFPESDLEHLCRREGGTVSHLIRLWRKRHRTPLWYQSGQARACEDSRLDADIARFGLGNLASHGASLTGGEAGSFFTFACLPEQVGPRHAHLLELLVPFMHAAWVRIALNHAQDEPGAGPQRHALLTARELEILGWVYEGKSNIDIGAVLQISSLTVKNHVQKILRKLNVQNRTQAVSRGIALNLLRR